MVFRSDKEKSKWDQLQAAGSVSIERIVSGKALPGDITNLSKLVEKQHKGAQKIFDDGIASAEATADALLDKMNEERLALGKTVLSAKAHDRVFKQTFQRVLSAQAEDILGSVKDYMDEKFGDQADANQALIEDAFEKVRQLTRSADAGSTVTTSGARAPSMPGGPTSIASKLGDLVGKVTKVYEQGKATGTKVTNLNKVLTTENPAEHDTGKTSILGNLRSLMTKGKTADSKNFNSLDDLLKFHGVRSDADIESDIRNKAGDSHTTVVDSQIKDALAANATMRQRAETHWSRLERDKGDKDEDKKANSWMRRIKNMFGKKSKRDGESNMGGILGTIGKVLLMALLSPELISTIAKTVGEYLNFSTISKFVSDTWKSIKESGSEILDWAIKKITEFFKPNYEGGVVKTGAQLAQVKSDNAAAMAIPANTSREKAASELAKWQPRLADSQKRQAGIARDLAAAKLADAKGSTEETRSKVAQLLHRQSMNAQDQDILGGRIANYQSVLTGKPAVKPASVVDQLVAPQSNAATLAPKSAPKAPSGPVGAAGGSGSTTVAGSSPVLPSTILKGSSASVTKIAPAEPAMYKDGIMVDNPQAMQQQQMGAGGSSSASSSPVSISSFGFSSGDDTMNLLNMGLIA